MKYIGGVLIAVIILVLGILAAFWAVVLFTEDVQFSPGDSGVIEDPIPQNAELLGCGIINLSGTYNLTSDLVAQRDCFTINASQVIIDGKGFSISGMGDGFGIKSGISGGGIIVKNLSISGFTAGINFNSVSGFLIEDNDFSGSLIGIVLNNSQSGNILDNVFSADDIQIILDSSQANVTGADISSEQGIISSDSDLSAEDVIFGAYDFDETLIFVEQGSNFVEFYDNLSVSGDDFYSEVSFSDNLLDISFDVSARVGLELSSNNFVNPVILINGNQCLDCTAISSLDGGAVEFEIPGSGSYSIGEDVFSPNLIVSFPDNDTYDEVDLTFEASLSEPGSVFFSLDGDSNVTMDSNGLEFSYDFENISLGNHSIRFYAEDSAGNANYSVEEIYFSVVDPDLNIDWNGAGVDFDDINSSGGVEANFEQYDRIEFEFDGDDHYIGVVDTDDVLLEVSNNESYERREISIGDIEEFDLNGDGDDIEVRFTARIDDQVKLVVKSLSYFTSSSSSSSDTGSPGTSQGTVNSGSSSGSSGSTQDIQNGSVSNLDSDTESSNVSVIVYGVFIFILVTVIIIAIYLIFNSFSQRNSLASPSNSGQM